MMKTEKARIIENKKIANDTYAILLETSIAKETECGQFVQVQVPGYYLRRPISVCEIIDDNTLKLVYKTVGDGTRKMSEMQEGETLDLFGPLGHGFPVENRSVLLIGGGVGVPPLVETAKQYKKNGQDVMAVLGYQDKDSIILKDELEALGVKVYIATMDGTYGTKGTVLDAIKANDVKETFVLACGPIPMLKAISDNYDEGYISLESRMACGMGACMGCVIKDTDGNSQRVCKDGPVFAIGKAVL